MWLEPWLCAVGQAINLTDPGPDLRTGIKTADLPGLPRGLDEIMHAPVITSAQICGFRVGFCT